MTIDNTLNQLTERFQQVLADSDKENNADATLEKMAGIQKDLLKVVSQANKDNLPQIKAIIKSISMALGKKVARIAFKSGLKPKEVMARMKDSRNTSVSTISALNHAKSLYSSDSHKPSSLLTTSSKPSRKAEGKKSTKTSKQLNMRHKKNWTAA